ncbi:HNH endonuclease [Paenibacillus jilunlii]|uniref:HNH endonuclease n=1 Tax=Paenibacillus jilunlii TaxID=682956 RepID=UPI003CC713A8
MEANCGKLLSNLEVTTIEHILPKAAGGSNSIENLVLTCRECNYLLSNNIKGFELYIFYTLNTCGGCGGISP